MRLAFSADQTEEITMDALSLLKEDHRQVERLFEDFQKEDSDKAVIATEICRLLSIHAQIEEEIFYPAVREALTDEESDDLLDEAEVEHASAKASSSARKGAGR
jgi:hemerythrin superfamily protein